MNKYNIPNISTNFRAVAVELELSNILIIGRSRRSWLSPRWAIESFTNTDHTMGALYTFAQRRAIDDREGRWTRREEEKQT